MKLFFTIAALLAVAAAQNHQQQQQTTPVPILKQINKHNEDGSYSYGYEGADGSYKIESKYPNGEVYGKYGYVDDAGKVREIEYGASQRGFEPAGSNIMVPPPTLHNNNEAIQPLGPNQEDDGQYREDPSVYYKDDQYNSKNQQKPASTPFRFNQVNYQQPAQQNYKQQSYQPAQQTYQQPQKAYQQPQQAYQQPQKSYQQPQQSYQQPQQSYQQPQQSYQPQQQSYQPQNNYNNYNSQPAQQAQPKYFNPAHPNFDPYAGHPATNLDIASGSYSVNYKR